MNNIIYENETKSGDNPEVTITCDQLTQQTDTVIHDLGVFLYDEAFNYGYGTVTLRIVKSADDTDGTPERIATIFYSENGFKYVANFHDMHEEYRHDDECASELIKKIVASM